VNPPPEGLPRLYSARDVAEALNASEWWVKKEAREGRLPHTFLAGKYQFTAAHLAEIVAQHERRPEASGTAATIPRRRQAAPTADLSVPRLQARPPRRLRSA
jgi:hypothetical protein